MIGSWLTSKTCRKSTSDWNADATRSPHRAAASECSEKSVAIKIVRNGTSRIYTTVTEVSARFARPDRTSRPSGATPLADALPSPQVEQEGMRKKTRVLLIVSQKTAGDAEYERILAILRDAGFELS